MLELDHIAVLGRSLPEAVAHVEGALSLSMGPGGRHARYGTHNRLIGLAPGVYLEAIAIDPDAPAPPDARWFGLDRFDGSARLDKWIARVPDIDAAIAALPMAGRRVDLERDGLRWSMAVPEDGVLPFDGLFPALIQWHVATPPGQSLPASGLTLEQVVVAHPEAPALEALLAPHLNAPLVSFQTASRSGLSARLRGPDGSRQL
ncbi:VOC family protein [Antarctobacter heliothermus]|uniref:Glyoxalase-like domain-containing protein n=1 Tax=Antarctobacter heliothermus TaxID=74033 RepID=A0A239BA06_9RHOB|nr:VOC family protein [Antarctobacter heliothermus]SNS03933.1 Glyoxalase-like domain-containing protein [Antarctobacter heliothermus]